MDTRYPEIDAARGVSVLAMIAYHLCFDLSLYYEYPILPESGGLWLFARITAFVFLTLTGICFSISWQRTEPKARKRKYLKRAGLVFGGGIVVTLVTWIIDPATFVIFGILHLIAVATLVQWALRRFGVWNLLIGALVFATAFFLPMGDFGTPLLLPFGILQKGFTSVDYYPLLPWLGPAIMGIGIGDLLYVPERKDALLPLDDVHWPRWLLWTGRRSLFVYFAHQPVLLLLLWLLLGR